MLCSTRLDVAYVTQLVNIMMITHIHKYCHSFSVLGLLLWFFCVFCFGLLPLTCHRKKEDQKFKDINSNLMKSQIRWFYKYHSFFLHSLLLYILTSVKVLCNCQNWSKFCPCLYNKYHSLFCTIYCVSMPKIESKLGLSAPISISNKTLIIYLFVMQ